MAYLPIVLREDNFPPINFKKLTSNRNNRIYVWLKAVNDVFAWVFRKCENLKTAITQDTPHIGGEQGEKIIALNR